MDFLTGIAGKALIGVFALAGLSMLIYMYRAEVKEAAIQTFLADEFEQASNKNADEVKRLEQEVKDRDKAIADLQAEKQRVRVVVKTVTRIVQNPTIADGEVAPVLRQTIDALREIDEERRQKESGNAEQR